MGVEIETPPESMDDSGGEEDIVNHRAMRKQIPIRATVDARTSPVVRNVMGSSLFGYLETISCTALYAVAMARPAPHFMRIQSCPARMDPAA